MFVNTLLLFKTVYKLRIALLNRTLGRGVHNFQVVSEHLLSGDEGHGVVSARPIEEHIIGVFTNIHALRLIIAYKNLYVEKLIITQNNENV
jgi:hypothetical protein